MGSTKLWRRISIISASSVRRPNTPDTDMQVGNIRLRKVGELAMMIDSWFFSLFSPSAFLSCEFSLHVQLALDILEWSADNVCFALDGRLSFTQAGDNMWTRRGRNVKLTPTYAVLVIRGNVSLIIDARKSLQYIVFLITYWKEGWHANRRLVLSALNMCDNLKWCGCVLRVCSWQASTIQQQQTVTCFSSLAGRGSSRQRCCSSVNATTPATRWSESVAQKVIPTTHFSYANCPLVSLQDPLMLDKCIVSSDTEVEGYFEVHDHSTKDTFYFKVCIAPTLLI